MGLFPVYFLVLWIFFLSPAAFWVIKVDPTLVTLLSLKPYPTNWMLAGLFVPVSVRFDG